MFSKHLLQLTRSCLCQTINLPVLMCHYISFNVVVIIKNAHLRICRLSQSNASFCTAECCLVRCLLKLLNWESKTVYHWPFEQVFSQHHRSQLHYLFLLHLFHFATGSDNLLLWKADTEAQEGQYGLAQEIGTIIKFWTWICSPDPGWIYTKHMG